MSHQSSVQRRTVTSSHSEGGGGQVDFQSSSYVPRLSMKSVVVNRSSTGGMRGSRSSMFGAGGMGSGYARTSMASTFNPAIYSQMAGAGIVDFQNTREKEKREMQDCNERLATYIEKVRWLEAKNKQLDAENEALRKRKQEDWRPIREMYESELNQAREVIKELSTQKGVNDAKLAGLQDEIESLKELISQYESNSTDYLNKIDRLNSQVGEYEGELTALRLRCGSLEDEIAKLRALIAKVKDENARLRADLDAETAAHIQFEVLSQSQQEEIDFLNELLEKLQLTQQEPVQIKGMDMESFFKQELKNSIREMNQAYEDKLAVMVMENEQKLNQQINHLKSGNVKETLEVEHYKSEIQRLKDQMAERCARIAELEKDLAMVTADRDQKMLALSDLTTEYDRFRAEATRKMDELQVQIESLLQQLTELMDAKMSLELEIVCYRKLLEGEENRTGLRQLVEQTIGVQGGGGGAAQMSQIIGGGGGGGSMMGGGGSSSTMTTSMKIFKSNTGPVKFEEVDAAGGYIGIALDASAKGSQDLRGLRLVKRVGNQEKFSVDLNKFDGMLAKGKVLKVCARGFKQVATDPSSELIASDYYSFDQGPGDYVIQDTNTKRDVATWKVSLAM